MISADLFVCPSLLPLVLILPIFTSSTSSSIIPRPLNGCLFVCLLLSDLFELPDPPANASSYLLLCPLVPGQSISGLSDRGPSLNSTHHASNSLPASTRGVGQKSAIDSHGHRENESATARIINSAISFIGSLIESTGPLPLIECQSDTGRIIGIGLVSATGLASSSCNLFFERPLVSVPVTRWLTSLSMSVDKMYSTSGILSTNN